MLADRINGKSCPFSSDIDKQMELGFNTLEIQLFDNQLESRENTLRLVDNCKKDGLDIKSIHSPLSKVVYSHLIENIDLDVEMYKNLFLFIDGIQKYFGHKMPVVFHTELRPTVDYSSTYKYLRDTMEKLVYMYPDITYTIENSCPIDKVKGFVNGALFENVRLCEMLRRDISKDHFNTTLDICHALAAVRLLKVLYEHDYTYNGRYIYMEDFVKENSETCNNIHFNWLTDFGFRGGEHGTIVDKDDKELAEVIGYINKYLSKDAKFTIEVLEKDYQNPKNCVILREALYYVENKLGISL